jgi:hypothetical protein
MRSFLLIVMNSVVNVSCLFLCFKNIFLFFSMFQIIFSLCF